jgi:hypothetical protein
MMNDNLFNNITNFSYLQLRFLQYLELYHSLYMDINSGEKLINYDRIKDDMLVDAYLVYKHKNKDRKDKKKNKRKKDFNTAGRTTNDLPQVVFRKRRKK